MLFFISYIQNQQQSRAKTTQKRPQHRRNPPFFSIFHDQIGHKTQFFSTNHPNFNYKTHQKFQKHINLI